MWASCIRTHSFELVSLKAFSAHQIAFSIVHALYMKSLLQA